MEDILEFRSGRNRDLSLEGVRRHRETQRKAKIEDPPKEVPKTRSTAREDWADMRALVIFFGILFLIAYGCEGALYSGCAPTSFGNTGLWC